MKHVLAMAYHNIRGHRTEKTELDYLRLVYAITKMRKEGEDAQGYFIAIAEGIPNQLSKWENDYRANQSVKLISALPSNYFNNSAGRRKMSDLSGIVATAILDTNPHRSNSAIRQSIQDGILDETMIALEPHIQQIKDESRFPLGIRWDYYGVVGSV
ncbi:MAG: hypothetical protein A2Z28_01305 [Chloroflexi bacterium RBG_16_51_9]|nr:MAG: hypothetical protein A2Z28_01305 [Chloroflexi bacterium RBG_16_51_9]